MRLNFHPMRAALAGVLLVGALILACLAIMAVVASQPAQAAKARSCGSYAPGSHRWYARSGQGGVRWVKAKRVPCRGARALVESVIHGKLGCRTKRCDEFMAPGDWYCVSRQTGYEAGTVTCESGIARVRWHTQA